MGATVTSVSVADALSASRDAKPPRFVVRYTDWGGGDGAWCKIHQSATAPLGAMTQGVVKFNTPYSHSGNSMPPP